MRLLLPSLAIAPFAAAEYLFGRDLPSTIAAPSTAGFTNPTIHFSRGAAAVCVSGHVSVAATSTKNIKFTLTPPTNQSTLTDIFLQDITSSSPFPADDEDGTQTVSGNYSIGASYCVPVNNTKPSKVQLLTHGIGFTRRYWDFEADYSYVDVAAANGFATFLYDRLGTGASLSGLPDPLQDIQVFLEIEIAAQLATSLKAGTYGGTAFSSVVGVGHSFGSIISQGVTAADPSLFSAVILTGFSANATALPVFTAAATFQIARENNPYRFSHLPVGWLVGGSLISTQQNFFRAPNFDPDVLALAYATGGTVTLGELFTTSSGASAATGYTSPVAVVNGMNDLPFCFGNCSYPTNLAAAAITSLYPDVATNKTTTYLAPNTGHGLNLHYTSNAAFAYIHSFLAKQGI